MPMAATALPIDAQGYIMLADGERASGFRLDAATGARLRSVTEPLRAPPAQLPASRTSKIFYAVNLPSGNFPHIDRRIREMAAKAENGAKLTILGCDCAAFLEATFAGGSVAIFNAHGASERLSLRWMRTESENSGRWTLFYRLNRKASFSEPAWRNARRHYTIPAKPVAYLEPNELVDVSVNGAQFGNVEIVHRPLGVTQYTEALSTVKISALHQDGAAAGAFLDAAAYGDGEIIARYGNGRMLRYAQIEQCASAA
ncbi:MAG: hypothetical protein SGJ17_05995 [Hyphomicrobiales bacterium]|nr:hypothetical protein [Hyphomicrobiales bacterium]